MRVVVSIALLADSCHSRRIITSFPFKTLELVHNICDVATYNCYSSADAGHFADAVLMSQSELVSRAEKFPCLQSRDRRVTVTILGQDNFLGHCR